MQKTNAVITVNGQDRVGIISTVSGILSKNNVNIADVTQTIMQSFFTMVMMVDISEMTTDFETLAKELDAAGAELGVQVRIQHEAIFNSMHRL